MFEKLILRRSENGRTVSIGEIAEGLLFYQNIHIIFDFTALIGLVQSIGIHSLMALLDRPNVTAVYCDDTMGTHSEQVGAMEYHSFVSFTLSGTQAGKIENQEQRIQLILTRSGCSKREASKLTERFLKKVPVKRVEDNYFLRGGIVKAARQDILDSKFTNEAIQQILVSTYGAESAIRNLQFEVVPSSDSFLVFSNIDFHAINLIRKAADSSMEDVTNALLVNEILMARADMAFASHYGGDYHTYEVGSKIVQLRYRELLKGVDIHSKELREFQEVTLSNVPSLKEVINSGEKTFEEFIKLLDKSKQFRNWIKGVNPDENLVKAYFTEVTSNGWVSSLPAKVLRYVIGGGVGLVASPLTGLAFSAADTFVVEKLASGWRPSHFIDGRMKPFLTK